MNAMKRVPYWAQGFLFACALIFLIFFLKVICPIDVGCLADPFLVPLFSPLKLLALFGIPELGQWEPLFIVTFWAVFAFFVGLFFEKRKRKQVVMPSEDEEET